MSESRRTFFTKIASVGLAALAGPHAFVRAASNHGHEHQSVPSDVALRVKSLETLLIEKGLVKPETLDAIVDAFETKIGPRNGARVVAKAWTDPGFRTRLIKNGNAAIAELGFDRNFGTVLRVVENGPKVHNLIVCTLCSCYPWSLLGLPPVWYKSAAYRSRAVIDPRGILREFNTELAPDVEIRTWDSTADQRYFVLPERPVGTEHLNETELAALVTRDSMIGTAILAAPPKGKRG